MNPLAPVMSNFSDIFTNFSEIFCQFSELALKYYLASALYAVRLILFNHLRIRVYQGQRATIMQTIDRLDSRISER
jgi:hypothetical protein